MASGDHQIAYVLVAGGAACARAECVAAQALSSATESLG
jgi:hypothetical protein